jgi:hypothetical protein
VIRNLTPHTVDLLVCDRTITVPADPAGPARVPFVPDIDAGTIDLGGGASVPLLLTQLGTEVTGLPEPRDGVTLIVSRQVAEARPERHDLVFPHRVARGPDGQPIGACALARAAERLILRVAYEAGGDGDGATGALYRATPDNLTIGSPIATYRVVHAPGFPTSDGLPRLEEVLRADRGDVALAGPVAPRGGWSDDYLVVPAAHEPRA